MATHTEHTDNAPSTNNGEVTLCKIGQILRIDRYRQHSAPKLLIRPLGRVDTIRPQGVKRNEVREFASASSLGIIVNMRSSDIYLLLMKPSLSTPAMSCESAMFSFLTILQKTSPSSPTCSFCSTALNHGHRARNRLGRQDHTVELPLGMYNIAKNPFKTGSAMNAILQLPLSNFGRWISSGVWGHSAAVWLTRESYE